MYLHSQPYHVYNVCTYALNCMRYTHIQRSGLSNMIRKYIDYCKEIRTHNQLLYMKES